MPKHKTYNYPRSLPLLKFFLNAEAIRKNPLPFHRKFFNSYGDTFSVNLGNGKRILLSRDKEVVQYILQKNHKNYFKSTIQTKYLSKYLGNGLLTANGDYWLQQRRLIQPAFHRKKMESLIALIQETIEEELFELPTKKEVDVFNVMNELAFNVVANALFNVSVSGETLKRLQKIIQEIQLFLVKEIRLPHKGWWFHVSGQVKRHKQLAQESREIIQKIIEKRKESNETHEDLLDMLLATRYEDTGEPMTTEQLIDEISILFVAGHETTANALTFTIFLLAKHPSECQKVYEEILKVTAKTSNLTEQIKIMEYTRAVIDESMRLYPPAWITDRENLEDDIIKDFHIRKNTLVGVSFYELHRHPEYWESPNAFKPERFIGEQKKLTNDCYYPFGAGPRMCIGMSFAVYEMVLATAYIVKNYRLKTNKVDIKLNPLITLKPIGVTATFDKRNN